MQDFIHFLIKYWYLVVAFLASLGLLIAEEARSKGMFNQLNTQQATQLINHKKALVLDIRDKNAFKQGHIINALNIPHAELERSQNKLEQYKTRPIIVVCSNGQQAGMVAVKLRKQGFEEAVALSGGMQTWQIDHMPVTTK